ncbi:STAS domain-containing protein [Aquibacillus salsiterrae]|uniref:STAS domain-containing protein n=1 Tax=Aquibacillus salsiterrae TaxID=2950439 RepID=A0A9X3WCI5_9BACI|nr:STAS domain-containing protein [Aquibacillus salsiterrae]MDC3417305.1 STAS domain-containing protein [Aquibacillus salsiterrae]
MDSNDTNSRFSWDDYIGVMKFEGVDAILFWTETAMKSFLDTLEEVSGDDAAEFVLETAGFRMGQIVSDFFNYEKQIDMIQNIPQIYADAGWGKIEIVQASESNKTVLIRLWNTWEYKINKLQDKKQMGAFLPGHIAGILTGLFNNYIGFEVRQSQIQGSDYDEIYYYPQVQSSLGNVHDFARKKEKEEIIKLEELVQERTKKLTRLVKEISSPIIPVLDNIVVIPLLGKYDEVRANDIIYQTMNALPSYDPDFLLLDLTGIDDDVDDYSVSLIQTLTSSVKLLGTECIIVGISPKISMKITESRFDLKGLEFFSTLKHGIHFALAQQGKRIIG